MSAEFGSGWLADYASRFKTNVTLLAGAFTAGQRVLLGNPRRWYLEVWGETFGQQMPPLMPGPFVPLGMMVPTIPAPLIWKYKDCPALVTGEFYSPYATGTGFLVFEQILVGD